MLKSVKGGVCSIVRIDVVTEDFLTDKGKGQGWQERELS
jgi:hypothetical protein